MNKKSYNDYIREGDDRETALCKSIRDEYKLPHVNGDNINCDECPGFSECERSFLGAL